MATFGEMLRKLRKSRELSQQDLARNIGISKSSINMYERNDREPGFETLEKIADYFNADMDYLLGKSEHVNKSAWLISFDKDQTRKAKGVKIPVLGSVAAGVPIEAIEDITDYEEITESMAATGDHFGLVIRGESMEPRMVDGDVVIVKRQDYIESGQIAVVIVDGLDATVKTVIKQENGIMLLAANSSVYPPKFYSMKEIERLPVKILGKVVELRAKF